MALVRAGAGKLVRLVSAARALALSAARLDPPAARTLAAPPTTSCIRDYATSKRPESLEPMLMRLDSDLRKFGRINKRDIDDIFDEIRARNDITSSQSLLVIRCCGELVPEELPEQRTLLVQKIWGVLSERGVPMDISHYNALLRVYLENEHPFSPAEFLDELEKKGLQPNRVTYQRLMWRYCQAGDVDGATRVLEKMRELALPVSEPVLNALVMGHAFHGDTDGARAVLDTMAGAGLQPSNRTYALLACGYARKGDVEGVKKIIQLTQEKDVIMSDKDIFDIVESLSIGGYSENVDYFLETMQKGIGYNQDALNAILRLINRGFEDTAKKVFRTMTKSSNLDGKDSPYKGAFFVKQLLKLNRPSDVVIKMCRKLQEEELVPMALQIAAEAALQQGHIYLAQELFKELKQKGIQIRQHYYWPLLVNRGKASDEQGLIEILRSMAAQDMTPSGETLRDYVIPYLRNNNKPETIVLKLQGANVPPSHAARNLMIELLDEGEIKQAAQIALQYSPWGQVALVGRPLVSALSKSKDVKSFVDLLHVVSGGPAAPQPDEENNDQGEDKKDNKGEVSFIILGAVKVLKNSELIDELFTLLLSRGIGVTNQMAVKIQERLGENMSTSLSEKLSQLTSSELELSPLQRTAQRSVVRSAPQIEALLVQAKSRGTNTAMYNRQLITAYMSSNEPEKLNSLLQQLEAEDFVLTGPTLAQLIEFYAQNDDVEKALHYKEVLEKKEPDFVLHQFKVMRLTLALVKAGRTDEALALLKSKKTDFEYEESSFLYNSLCWQVLNHLAEQMDAAKVKEMIDTMFENKFAEPSNSLLGPLIKVHLLKDDLDSAMAEFERCCETYRCTPWKSELTRRLIACEDAARLQRLTDLSTAVHGEANSLYDLVLAFVECGRLRQARRILETPGLRTRSQRLNFACERYVQEGKTECLEGLLEATRELSHIDRTNMFYHLLVSYCKADETDKALGLWTLLQEEDLAPSDQFLTHLGKHLKSKNRDVPFVMPLEEEPPKTQKITKQTQSVGSIEKPQQPENNKRSSSKILNDIQLALTSKNTEELITLVETAKHNDNITKKLYSDIIEFLIKQNNTSDAVKVTIKAIQNDTYPETKVVKFLLKTLAEAGEEDKILQLGPLFNDNKKKEITYDNKLTQARVAGGGGAVHVNGLVAQLAGGAEGALSEVVQRYPRSTALATIIKDPDSMEKCHKLAEATAEQGNLLPANLLWMEYLLVGNDSGAKSLWEKYLFNGDMIIFRRILQESHVRDDPTIIETLIGYLKENKKITSAAVGNAYSRLVGLHLSHNRSVQAKELLDKAVSDGVKLEEVNRTTLLRLKQVFESEGKTFEYTIPAASK